jgi:NAD(P)-dependent dehydrogenase (short-subunit alcohol dehydrogenase family)
MAAMSMKLLPTNLLEGERALITGCAGGIGRGIAKALLAEGATVLGSDITAPPPGDGIDFLAADLSRPDGWKGLLDAAVKKLGTISLFVHAASPRRREVDTPLSVSEETWDAMTDINLRSGFFLAREVGRHMRDGKIKGRMLLITSMHRETPRNLPHYSASKAGMTMVMKELARVLAPDGIRVNAIAPGAIPGGGFVADNLAELVAQIPLGRPGTPDDIAQVAVAILSERFGRYVVGTTVEVDGGIGLTSWIPAKA